MISFVLIPLVLIVLGKIYNLTLNFQTLIHYSTYKFYLLYILILLIFILIIIICVTYSCLFLLNRRCLLL